MRRLIPFLLLATLAGCSPSESDKPTAPPTPTPRPSGMATPPPTLFADIYKRRPAPPGTPGVDAAETALSKDKGNPAKQLAVTLAYYATGGYDAAEKSVSGRMRGKPMDGASWLYLGYSRMGLGQFDTAVGALELAQRRDDLTPAQKTAALVDIGNLYFQALGNTAKAEEAFLSVLKDEKADAVYQGEAALGLGTLQASQSKADDAKKNLELAAQKLPAGKLRASAYAGLGRLAEEAKDTAGAKGWYEKALKDDPQNAWAKQHH